MDEIHDEEIREWLRCDFNKIELFGKSTCEYFFRDSNLLYCKQIIIFFSLFRRLYILFILQHCFFLKVALIDMIFRI